MRDALRDLPARWRQASWLAQIEGLQEDAIADVLGVPSTAVPELLDHARAFVRERFEAAVRPPPVSGRAA